MIPCTWRQRPRSPSSEAGCRPNPAARRGSPRTCSQSPAAWRAALLLFVLIAPSGAHEIPSDARTADQRIAYFKARLGGPATYPAHARLGLALLDKAAATGDTRHCDEALTHLQASLDYQRNHEALLGLALAHASLHQFPKALAFARESLQASPDSAPTLAALSDIHLALGDVAEAARALERLRKFQPGFASLARQAALSEYRGELAAALSEIRDAAQSVAHEHPPYRLAWTLVREGSLQLACGEAGPARECYERALKLLPGSLAAREQLARWHAAQGEWPEARRQFEQLLKDNPAPRLRVSLAECTRRLGDIKAAEREEQAALEALRARARLGTEDQLRPLALLLLQSESPSGRTEGLRWAKRDAELRQDAFAIDTLAWAHWSNGNTNEALHLASQALKSENRDPLLRLHAGLILTGAGAAEKGRALLDETLARTATFGPHERKLLHPARVALAAPVAPVAPAAPSPRPAL